MREKNLKEEIDQFLEEDYPSGSRVPGQQKSRPAPLSQSHPGAKLFGKVAPGAPFVAPGRETLGQSCARRLSCRAPRRELTVADCDKTTADNDKGHQIDANNNDNADGQPRQKPEQDELTLIPT
ncbi:hypothetical protein LR48_Vigan01g204700 [Vigna angularis]|uniref:Uncharacterized protein n=1 Tax=Phaseolus angularis TaxID=3914 RepID=A0A0L9TPV0_PHAAN|nr:hypothetical protein LR48_Vigan01g204700 [Vigna angularis]